MAKTVLIVDDLQFVRRTLRDIFQAGGYQVCGEAADGREAVALHARMKPDLITMDLVMPELSGIDATRLIVKNDPGARVVIISAMGQENLVMEAVNAGARDFLLKPFTAADVLRAAEKALQSGTHPQPRLPTTPGRQP